MAGTTQIHPDIPLDRAWKAGRRIYVRSAYKSQLNADLRAIGATWDRDEECLWVGSGKLDAVIPLIQAQAGRAAAVQAVKDAGHWIAIPFQAEHVRDQAKQLGARWDRDRKEWALPDAEALAAVQAALTAWNDQQAEARARSAAESRARKTETAGAARDRIVAASGRTVTGDPVQVTYRLEGRGRRAWAETCVPEAGTVMDSSHGRLLVLSGSAEFRSEDALADQSPHLEPGWRVIVSGVPVEPTADERAADQAAADAKADAAHLAAEFTSIAKACTDPVTPAKLTGQQISKHTGSTGLAPPEYLALTDAGTVRYHHPGHYDDWRVAEGESADPDVIARFGNLLTAGARQASHDRSTYHVALEG
jgi:hypothetical protein